MYDCWKTDEEPVAWEAILTVFRENAKAVTTLLVDAIGRVAPSNRESDGLRRSRGNAK